MEQRRTFLRRAWWILTAGLVVPSATRAGLNAERESLRKTLDRLRPLVEPPSSKKDAENRAQWGNWQDWRNGWNDWRDWRNW